MARSVKIADDEMDIVRAESALQSRSIAGQITHWMRIGRAIERSAAFDYARVRAALQAELSPDALTGEEQAVWLAALDANIAEPTQKERDFFAKRRREGRGVGLDKDGKLVYQKPQD